MRPPLNLWWSSTWHLPFPILRFCLVRFQFCCLIFASLSLCTALLHLWIWVGESTMHTNEIICCDWVLDIAAAESNLQFLKGEKGVCLFPRSSLVIHDHKFLLTVRKCSIYFVHEHENQVFCMAMYLRVWFSDFYMWWKVLFIVASNTTDLFCCCSTEME